MTEIQTYDINNRMYHRSNAGDGDKKQSTFNIDAHISTDMKVKRPKVNPNDLTTKLPLKQVFSDKEATKRMQAINTDIYEGAVQEKEKHEFNLKRYFTIFGIIALITAAIAYLRKK